MSRVALTPIQQKKYQSIKNKTIAKRYKVYCLATARNKRREEEEKRKAAKPPRVKKEKPPKLPKPPSPHEEWREQIKAFNLTPKPCSELKVGDVFKTSVFPYFAEVVEFLPNKDLPPFLIAKLKLLPDNITGEGTFLLPDNIVLVKEKNS